MQTALKENYFDIFGIDTSYSVDEGRLRDRFRDLQRKFHPDNFASASDQEKRLSAQYAAHINEAFTTLKDPVLRGRYMLSLHGMSTDEDHDTRMDKDFPMQQMELREDLELALSADGGPGALMDLSDRVDREYRSKADALGEVLDAADDLDLELSRRLVRELQFLNRIRQEIIEAEESFL